MYVNKSERNYYVETEEQSLNFFNLNSVDVSYVEPLSSKVQINEKPFI